MSGQLDVDVVSLDPHRKRGVDKTCVQTMLACRHVELPAVPGAGDDAARQAALPQGTASMRANPVHRVKRPVHIKECDHPAAGGQFLSGPRRNLGDSGNPVR